MSGCKITISAIHRNMNVIITGASRGIGRAIAEAYAAEGATLFLCSRQEGLLLEAVSDIRKKFPAVTVHAQAANLADRQATIAFGNWCLSLGVPDILVNNAGSFVPGNVYDEAEGNLEQMMSTNLYSAYHLTRTILPAMMNKKNNATRGHIFNICSVAALDAYPNGGAYSISKFALSGFSKNLRKEMMPHGIRVTVVYPGAVMTDSWGGFDNSNGRIMEASDIARMIIAAGKLSPQAVVEDIVMRPQLGDL